jgi:hypothetical protein
MGRPNAGEHPSLAWIHQVREEAYRETKDLDLEQWLVQVDAEEAAAACRSIGLRVRLGRARARSATTGHARASRPARAG